MERIGEMIRRLQKEKVAYLSRTAIDRTSIIAKIKNLLDQDGRIKKAWIFGSFARGDDGRDSDFDLLIEEDKKLNFSYFDPADVQFRLEKLIQKKVDLGFSDSAKVNAAPQIMNEAVLIYEKPFERIGCMPGVGGNDLIYLRKHP